MHATLDVVGIFAFGVSGALMAIRSDFDVVGIAILAVVTALGGGIIRDLVLGDTPPPAFVPLAAAAVAFVAHPEFDGWDERCSSSTLPAWGCSAWPERSRCATTGSHRWPPPPSESRPPSAAVSCAM